MAEDRPTFIFRPAKRENIGLFIGLAGPSGSGKTFSALRLARGLVGPAGRIATIDTEGRRMSVYAERFAFDGLDLEPPFRPERFAELARQAEASGYGCLIIDSFTHEWRGEGGVLEWHDTELDRLGGGDDQKRERNNMRAWIEPKRAHRSMMGAFLQRRMPMLFCIRGEERVKVGPGGKPQLAGWMPQTDLSFMYDLTCSLMLSDAKPGCVDWRLPKKIMADHLPFLQDGTLLDESVGQKFAEWLGNLPLPTKTANGHDDAETRVRESVDRLCARVDGMENEPSLTAFLNDPNVTKWLTWLSVNRLEDYQRVAHAINQRQIALRSEDVKQRA
jgi:AAA domain